MELTEQQIQNSLFNAMESFTQEQFDNLGYGEQLKLNDLFVLYRYDDGDFYSIVLEEEWEEHLAVLSNGDGSFEFESLI